MIDKVKIAQITTAILEAIVALEKKYETTVSVNEMHIAMLQMMQRDLEDKVSKNDK